MKNKNKRSKNSPFGRDQTNFRMNKNQFTIPYSTTTFVEEAREQIKILLAQEGLKQKDLAAMITEKTGKLCLPNSLSQKMGRGTLSYNDMLVIAELLGYKIQFVKDETNL